MNCAYRFVLEIKSTSGQVVCSSVLDPDWEPAQQGTRLSGLRTRNVWHDDSDASSVVEPLWDADSGPPMTRTLRIRMRGADHEWFEDFATSDYFAESARAVVAARLASGELATDDEVRYSVSAYEIEPQAPAAGASRLQIVDRPQPLGIRDRDFSARMASCAERGSGDPADIDVMVPQTVLDEVCALTQAAATHETGGILLGHLCRDEARHDVGLEVTAQIPARHTVSEPEKLTFTSETWTDVRSAVALRNQGELLVGWWHSHPAISWCAKCPIERQRSCHFATGFLSLDDKALHRSVFPAAFTQALVVTNSAAGLDSRMFGWRHGVLKPRAFRVS